MFPYTGTCVHQRAVLSCDYRITSLYLSVHIDLFRNTAPYSNSQTKVTNTEALRLFSPTIFFCRGQTAQWLVQKHGYLTSMGLNKCCSIKHLVIQPRLRKLGKDPLQDEMLWSCGLVLKRNPNLCQKVVSITSLTNLLKIHSSRFLHILNGPGRTCTVDIVKSGNAAF